MTIEIKRATRNDAYHLAVLCAEVQSLHVEMQPTLFRQPTCEQLARFFREHLADPDFVVFLALAEGHPVGYVMLHVIRTPAHVLVNPRECVEIDHLHVQLSHRRQGIGRALASRALEVARTSGVETIQLSVWAQNQHAVAAFESLGFEPLRHIMILKDTERLEYS